MIPRRLARTLLIAAVSLVAAAHVGSPDTWFAGDAGPYRVLVHVRSPGVIPGIADVTVEVQGDPPTEVLAHVNRFDAVTAPPPPDVAKSVEGRPGTYRARLWVMTSGSNSVTVQVRGPRGQGMVVVPATIVAFRRLEFSRPLALALGGVGVFLFAGLVTIIGAAVRESALLPGVEPDARRRRRAVLAMGGATVVLGLTIFGGKRWWDAEDRAYRQSMFKPLGATAQVSEGGSRPVLRLAIADESWRPTSSAGARAYSPLVPDHGKLMHLFTVREDLNAIAHLHPETSDTVTFSVALPTLPAGRYLIFGDITHESGFSQTLTATADVPASVDVSAPAEVAASEVPTSAAAAPQRAVADERRSGSSGDDAWFSGEPAENGEALLADGSTMRWERGDADIVAGFPAPLRFVVHEPDGTPAVLEPYMGMDGHAIVVREDGSVFVHLHPMGTVSAAAQLAFELRKPSDSLAGMLAPRLSTVDAERASRHGAHAPVPVVLSFPYAFPSAGRYRVWVQIKRDGRVLTGAFPVDVSSGASDPLAPQGPTAGTLR